MDRSLDISDRLLRFVIGCGSTAYPEPESELHTKISTDAWERCRKHFDIVPPGRVLDLGCGSGFMSRYFDSLGYGVISLTRLDAEALSLSDAMSNVVVVLKDMHDLRFVEPNYFDLVWARHVLEHSPCPAFVLSELRCMTKDKAWLYVEVPMPDTCSEHQNNANHWTVLTASGWEQLICRSGFEVVERFSFRLDLQIGTDCYIGFVCRRQ